MIFYEFIESSLLSIVMQELLSDMWKKDEGRKTFASR